MGRAADIRKLIRRLADVTGARVVVEATGGYEGGVLEACRDAGLWVSRINPRQARDFAHAIAARTRELAAIDREMRTLLKTHATPALQSSKGMGPIFQATSLALPPELGTLTRQQIARLVGVVPYMVTLSALRGAPTMRAHYQQPRARGKLGKFALVACMRKLLTIVNARQRDELRDAGGLAIAA